MYAIMGITGQIGGVIARTLLAAKQPVRAVVRDAIKGRAWSDCGCEVVLSTIEDRASLVAAFREAEGVFVLVPPNFDPFLFCSTVEKLVYPELELSNNWAEKRHPSGRPWTQL